MSTGLSVAVLIVVIGPTLLTGSWVLLLWLIGWAINYTRGER